MNEQQPTNNSRQRYKSVVIAMTSLFGAALVVLSLWPLISPHASQPASAPVAVAPQPPTGPGPKPGDEKPTGTQPQAQGTDVKDQVVTKPKVDQVPPGEATIFVEHGSRTCPEIALTYDAGSGADGAAPILDTLAKLKIPATFFLTGHWVDTYPDLARRIASGPYQIANHTMTHEDLTKLTPEELTAQVKQGEAEILKVTGRETKPFFREPYGAFDLTERKLVRQTGFIYSVYWDLDTLDWQFPPLETEINRILTKVQNGSVVLMHLNVAQSAKATEQVVPILQAKGYRFVTVQQLLQCQ